VQRDLGGVASEAERLGNLEVPTAALDAAQAQVDTLSVILDAAENSAKSAEFSMEAAQALVAAYMRDAEFAARSAESVKFGMSDAQIDGIIRQVAADVLATSPTEGDAARRLVDMANSAGVSLERVGQAFGANGEQTYAYLAQYGLTGLSSANTAMPSGAVISREAKRLNVTDAVLDQAIVDYVQQQLQLFYPDNTEQAVRNIHAAAMQYGIGSARMAQATGMAQADIIKLAELYNLPAFAEGGIVNQPTLALIGEEGPEAITPLTRSSNYAPLPRHDDGKEEVDALRGEIRELRDALLKSEEDTKRLLEALIEQQTRGDRAVVEAVNENTQVVAASAKTTARLVGNQITAKSK
jgi:hypothetical protein